MNSDTGEIKRFSDEVKALEEGFDISLTENEFNELSEIDVDKRKDLLTQLRSMEEKLKNKESEELQRTIRINSFLQQKAYVKFEQDRPWLQFKGSGFTYCPPRTKFKTNKSSWAKQ